MIDPKYTDLMNLVLDGKASPRDREDLDQYLGVNPEARGYYQSLSYVVRHLSGQPMVEPPAELHPRVMSAVDNAMARAARPSLASWLTAPRFRFIPVFGVGLVAGVALLSLAQPEKLAILSGPRDVDPALVSGSMVTPARPIVSIPIDAPESGVSGRVDVLDGDGRTLVDVDLVSDEPVQWIVTYDPSAPQPYVVKVIKSGNVVIERSASPVR